MYHHYLVTLHTPHDSLGVCTTSRQMPETMCDHALIGDCEFYLQMLLVAGSVDSVSSLKLDGRRLHGVGFRPSACRIMIYHRTIDSRQWGPFVLSITCRFSAHLSVSSTGNLLSAVKASHHVSPNGVEPAFASTTQNNQCACNRIMGQRSQPERWAWQT